jgi:hypothetical protein
MQESAKARGKKMVFSFLPILRLENAMQRDDRDGRVNETEK